MHGHKLGEVESECTSHNFILFAIFVAKIFTVEIWQSSDENNSAVFLRYHLYTLCPYPEKKSLDYFRHNFIQYWPIFEILSLCRKFAIKRLLNIPPHLKRVTTLRLDIPCLSSFFVRLSTPKVFRLLQRNSLITPSSLYPIIRYKILINALTSSVIIISGVFYDIVRVYKKIVS